jgi:hypothetical protein
MIGLAPNCHGFEMFSGTSISALVIAPIRGYPQLNVVAC